MTTHRQGRPSPKPAWHALVAAAALLGVADMAACRAADESPPRAAGDETAGFPDNVVARIDQLLIERSELEVAVQRVGGQQLREPEQRLRLEAEVLEQLVNERLLRQAVAAEKITVDADEVAKFMVRMRSELTDRGVPFDAFLAQTGRDEESLRSQIELDLSLNKMLAPQLTSDALAAMFATHRRELDGTRLRVSHIILRPDPARGADVVPELMRKAEMIRRSILQGTITFADAAKKHSAGPSRRQGGDVGYFPRQGTMHEDFAREAFALAKGELSKPFATPFGVHVVTVTGIEPGNMTAARVRPQLEKLIVQESIRDMVARGRKATPITYAPGVAHFDGSPAESATVVGGQPQRRVVVVSPAASDPAPAPAPVLVE